MSEQSLEDKVEEKKLGKDGYVLIPAERVSNIREFLKMSGYVMIDTGGGHDGIYEDREYDREHECTLGYVSPNESIALKYDHSDATILSKQLNLRRLLDVNGIDYTDLYDRTEDAKKIIEYSNCLIELAKQVETHES